MGIIAAAREQRKIRTGRTEKLNCEAVATKVSVDSIRNSESGMSFESCPERDKGVDLFTFALLAHLG